VNGKSAAIVRFIANLLPLYHGERHGDTWCARSLQDGSLILPIADDQHDEGWVRIHWQGDPCRKTEALGESIATLALDRYVRLHGAGASEEAIAAELWFMARHFHYKTGCYAGFPQLPEPPNRLVQLARTAKRMGEGVLVNVISRVAGA